MEKIIKKLVFNEDDLTFDECNYINKRTLSPSLEILSQKDVTLARLIEDLTGQSVKRRDSDFRRSVFESLVPMLPNVTGEAKFLHRRLNEDDIAEYDGFQGNTFTVSNGFMAFYQNGLRAGGTKGYCNVNLICEDFSSTAYLGFLSQVPTEQEVLVAEGVTYERLHDFPSLGELLASNVLNTQSARDYFESWRDYEMTPARYIYIAEIR